MTTSPAGGSLPVTGERQQRLALDADARAVSRALDAKRTLQPGCPSVRPGRTSTLLRTRVISYRALAARAEIET
jgi:hypothetical protein